MNILTTSDAARVLGVDPSRVRVLCRTGRLGRKHGHAWLITSQDIDAYRAAGPRKSGPKIATGCHTETSLTHP